MTLEQKQTNLLGIHTIELNVEQLRQKQQSYYFSLGISKKQIEKELQFSTPSQRNGVYLYPKGEIFEKTEKEVSLEILDADSRTVVISPAGFQILEKLQLKMTQNLFQLMQKLKTIFPEHMITGRVKSARSFLDKCGRLCEKTQKEATDKCQSTLDIVDVCGCRITCSSSAQIFAVIEKLRKSGFEFLELDNKYNTIRKDGAYKVIPCTLKDPETGLIFELQITTLTSTIVSDLFHNVIYKQHTIGLNPTPEEQGMVLTMQRFGAVAETVSLVSKHPIVLTERLKGEAMLETFDLLKSMIESVREHQPAKL
jgi:ppGpp synthetase/RelA/SpoT-type nucleotidyltranferase